MAAKNFEVIIIGAGVSGTALTYELARYTDIGSIALLKNMKTLLH
jgi:malate dehydrogenase (quinone)